MNTEYLCEGDLEVLHGRKWVTVWGKLSERGFVLYHDDEDETATGLVATVELNGESVIRQATKKEAYFPDKNFIFSLRGANGETCLFSCYDFESLEEWVREIELCISDSTETFLVEKLVQKWNVQEVGWWLDAIGFGEYKNVFSENGIDGKQLVGMQKNDLKKLTAITLGDRLRLLRKIQKLQFGVDISDNSSSEGDESASSPLLSNDGLLDSQAQVVIKCYCEQSGDAILVWMKKGASYSDFKKKIAKEFDFKVMLKYSDAEGDEVTIREVTDYEDAIGLAHTRNNALKVSVYKAK